MPGPIPIAAMLALALCAALLWSGQRVHDDAHEDALEAATVPDPEDAVIRLETEGPLARESRRGAPGRQPASTGFESGDVEALAVLLAGEHRGASGSAARADPRVPAFEIIRSTLAQAIDARLPELALSTTELDDLAQATSRLRRAQAALRSLPKTREHAERRALERRRLEEAVADFTYLLEMTPAEFSRRVGAGAGARVGAQTGAHVGIDEWPPDDASDQAPAPVSIRPIEAGEAPE